MGAIKPPWISKEEFYRLPFNFCDRWCKRCNLTGICKVYQEDQKEREKAIKEGKDPDSWEFAFEVIQKNFKETRKLLYEGAKKWGIDMKKIEKEVAEEMKKEDFTKPPAYQKSPIYRTTLRLSHDLYQLLKELDVVPLETETERIKDDIEVLSFYRSLILAKTARSLSSEEREENYPEDLKTYDEKTSAFIVYHALDKISQALINLSKEKTLDLTRQKGLTIAKASINLAKTLSEKFHF